MVCFGRALMWQNIEICIDYPTSPKSPSRFQHIDRSSLDFGADSNTLLEFIYVFIYLFIYLFTEQKVKGILLF